LCSLTWAFDDGSPCGAALLEWATGEIHTLQARAVLLATGGFGKVYKTTSNCFTTTGDAVSIAFGHGVPLQDMEFVQFHPTGIRGMGILISEAARGEGGFLVNRLGERFMERYAPTIRDLAPRYNLELVEALECEHLLTLAAVMLKSALFRRESRDAHFREDFPERDDRDFLCHTLIVKVRTRLPLSRCLIFRCKRPGGKYRAVLRKTLSAETISRGGSAGDEDRAAAEP
jgi:succinate dehydrogenase/fumarate reductase flavoprotein subunit